MFVSESKHRWSLTYIHLILLKQGYYSLEYWALFDERSFYNQFIYNVGVLRTLHIDGPNWFDNDLQNTTQKTEDSEIFQEKFEDTKEAIKTRKSKKDRQHNGQNKRKGTKDKQLQVSTKHYTKNWRFGNISRKGWRYQKGNK